MITELLKAALNNIIGSDYEITEIQLGEEPYRLFIEECETLMDGISIKTINTFHDITIKQHSSNDAIMYSIQEKKFYPTSLA